MAKICNKKNEFKKTEKIQFIVNKSFRSQTMANRVVFKSSKLKLRRFGLNTDLYHAKRTFHITRCYWCVIQSCYFTRRKFYCVFIRNTTKNVPCSFNILQSRIFVLNRVNFILQQLGCWCFRSVNF